MSDGRIRALVDRYEGECAILLLGGEGREALWPADLLPEGTREGAVLWIDLGLDAGATELERDKIRKLVDRLKRGE